MKINIKKNVYVFGNLLYEKDSLPIKLIPILNKEIPDVKFIEFEPTEGIETVKEKELIIIDSIKSDNLINEVVLIDDLNKIETNRVCSLHDFDLGYNLKLMKKFGLIEKVFIIGLPEKIEIDKAVEKIKKILKN